MIGVALLVYVAYHLIESNQPAEEDDSANTPIDSGSPAPNPYPNASWISQKLKMY